jgi:RsiW-degrading membrane proteinase PrsW (M82 family)
MSTFPQLARLFFLVFILVLGGRFIWLKRTGRWKRPWSFPVAMVLLGLAIILVSLGNILSYFGGV